jgi:hypothetical protein
MRNYVITYVTDVQDFIQELEQLAPQYVTYDEDTKEATGWIIQTTPIVKNHNGTLAMSILTDGELSFISGMTTIRSLGTYNELFSVEDINNEYSPAPSGTNLEVYQSVYPYHIPITYIDENGVEYTYYRPKYIGDFGRQ